MSQTLFKKQMMEVFSWVYQDKKAGKNRTVKGSIGYALLYLVIFGFLGSVFYVVANTLCPPLANAGMGWLCFAIMGLIAMFFGVFGSVFNTYASLYKAKDNDLLLAMPIPAEKILLIRLSGVYFTGLMYELIVMIPVLIVWFRTMKPGVAGMICSLFVPIVLSVLILVFSALVGWLVAMLSDKLKHKNGMIVFFSLIFIALYYYCFGRSYAILQSILANPQAVGDKIRGIFYPMYHMGLAAEGNLLSMLIFTAIAGILFAVVFWALSRNFLKIATANRGGEKTKYKEKSIVFRSASQALFQKELRRFLGSAVYMLNCGLGIVVMLVSAGALVWKQGEFREILHEFFPGNRDVAFLLGAVAVCTFVSMNDITAPSVSLEGKNLWIAQAFPVSGRQVLMAKLKLHLVLTLIPAVPLIAVVEWLLQPTAMFAVLIPVVAVLFVTVMAGFGLFLGVKTPNLHWTSEIVPIKQSLSVMACLFGGWALIVALSVGYYFLAKYLSPLGYLLGVTALLFVLSILLLYWLRTKGAELFEKLI